MKILLISDTHGRQENLARMLEQLPQPDHVLHMGDTEGYDGEIRGLLSCPVTIVMGNNDFFSHEPRETELVLGGIRFFLTHGHRYGASFGIGRLVDEALSRRAGVVCFGHTHQPMIRREQGVLLINPGSLSYPRQSGRRPSCAWLEIAPDGELKVEIKYL